MGSRDPRPRTHRVFVPSLRGVEGGDSDFARWYCADAVAGRGSDKPHGCRYSLVHDERAAARVVALARAVTQSARRGNPEQLWPAEVSTTLMAGAAGTDVVSAPPSQWTRTT